ncbi:MAG: general secretion pathway protein GspB [Smithellaceae bacterium]
MSYILEGLKKLEKKRQRGEGSLSLLDNPVCAGPRPRKQAIWPYLLTALLMINALLISWWVFFYIPDGRSVQASAGIMTAEAPPAGHDEDTPSGGSSALHRDDAQEAIAALPPLPEKQTGQPLPPAVKPAKIPHPSGRKDSIREASLPSKPASASIAKADTSDRLVAYGNLPASVKKALPDMKIFLHFYSPNRLERFVQINEHTLQEGQVSPEGLKVIQITEQAVLLSFQGYRFEKKAIEK